MSDTTNSPVNENTSGSNGLGAGDSAAAPGKAPGKNRRRTVIVGGAAAALVVAGGAVALGASGMFGGGGGQPEDVLPGDAVVFLKVDLDPSVAQKVGAFRLMDKFPEAKNALGSGDPKKALFEMLAKSDTDLADVDYAQDVEPWLGDRVGLAMLAPSGPAKEPVPVFAVQVKDEAKAREGIAKLREKGKASIEDAKTQAGEALAGVGQGSTPSPTSSTSEPVQIFKDGYLVVTDADNEQQVRSAMDAGVLSANDTFKGDMAAIGEQGVASGWVDGPKSFSLQPNSTPAAMEELASLSGRSAFAVRFAADYVEMAQVNRDVKLTTQAPVLKDVSNLPPTTGAFYSFAGGNSLLGEMWPTLEKFVNAAGASEGVNLEEMLKQVEQQTGLVLPADAQTMLGDQFDVIVPKQDFRAAEASAMPQVGLRIWGDTLKSQATLKKLTDAANKQGVLLPITTQADGGYLNIALAGNSLANYASLTQGETVSQAPGFATVLPDLATASGALYVNLDAYESQYLDQVPADRREAVQALQSVGMTSTPISNGEQRATLRVSVN